MDGTGRDGLVGSSNGLWIWKLVSVNVLMEAFDSQKSTVVSQFAFTFPPKTQKVIFDHPGRDLYLWTITPLL